MDRFWSLAQIMDMGMRSLYRMGSIALFMGVLMMDVALSQDSLDLEVEEGFRLREESVIGDLTEMQGIVLATGGGSVMSKEVRNKLSARGIVVYLETPIEKQVARTQRDKRRPLLQTEEAPRNVLERLAEEREPLYKEVADFVVRTDEQSAKVVANQIIEKLDF